jgi:hypothetical protein
MTFKEVVMKKFLLFGLAAVLALITAPVQAQDSGDRIVVNFSDPSRPGLLRVNIINGSISVRSHSGGEVIIETRGSNRNRRPPVTPDGLRRIDNGAMGLSVEEENNVMSIGTRNSNDFGSLVIQVPAKTNLNLKTINGGGIEVDNVEGEIEVNNTNGSVQLNNVAGSIVAHATNGRITATLREIAANKPTSFTSMNSNIDVTLPATTKANLKLRSDNGGTWSDFEIQLRSSPITTLDDQRAGGGRYRIQTDRTINGTINGGGPDVDMRTLNGNIYIRKGK